MMAVPAAQVRVALSETRAGRVADGAGAIGAVRAGDPVACREFVAEHLPRMMAVARRFFRCEHECADTVQEAFVSALRSLSSFEGGANVSTWLHRIVVNACLMRIRSRARRGQVSIEGLLPVFDEAGRHVQPVEPWLEGPPDRDHRDELRDHVRQCLDRLPDGYREVIVLRDIEEMSTEQTARMLGISEANVKVRLHRARQAMRALLAPYMASSAPAAPAVRRTA